MPAGRPKARNPHQAFAEAFRASVAPVVETTRPTERLLDFCELMEPWFRTPPHVHVMADGLEALERADTNRLILLLPPRECKTTLSSRLFPAWCMGRHPNWQQILTSYGAELAEENSAVARNYLADDAWPFAHVRLARDTRGVARWKTTKDGICVAVGMGGAITGRGAHLLVIDDPVKGPEEARSEVEREKQWAWYQMVARPRLMPGGRILICETCWHEDDIVGRILNSRDANQWTVIRIPAFADEENDVLGRKIGEYLPDALIPEVEIPSVAKGEISPHAYAALYQQRPTVAGGNYFTEEAWTADRPTPALRPLPSDFHEPREDDGRTPRDRLRLFQFWDVAFSEARSADFTVCITVGANAVNDIFVLDVLRKHLSPFTMGQEMIELFNRWRPAAVGIEHNTFREKVIDDLVRQLRNKVMARVLPVPVDRDKETRAGLPRERAEAGKLYADRDASWYPVFRDELLAFPSAKYDDQVDALSGACELIRALGQPQPTRISQYGVGAYQTRRGPRGAQSAALWRELLGAGRG